jgi:transposase InsO family protein
MEAIPLAITAAAEVAAALFSGWICRFGVPAIITSDRGSQFTSNIWNSLCLLLQIKHQPTTAYHPQANGMVERLHRRLKDALRARGATATWAAELPWVLLGLRSSPREDTNLSPAQALYGTPLVLPNQYLSITMKNIE